MVANGGSGFASTFVPEGISSAGTRTEIPCTAELQVKHTVLYMGAYDSETPGGILTVVTYIACIV